MKFHNILFLFSLLLLVNLNLSFGFESFPEFGSLTEVEEATLEDPYLLNPEYPSDFITYQKPLSWYPKLLSSDLYFDSTVGSISSRNFIVFNRLKFRSRLTEFFEFRFTYYEERDWENDYQHPILELVFWPWQKIGFSIYAEANLYKRKDDSGASLLFKPIENSEIKVFHTWVDVLRLNKNDRTDTYTQPYLPYARGIVARFWNKEAELLEVAFRNEPKTFWEFPDSSYLYKYSKNVFLVKGRKKLKENFWIQSSFQFDRKFESKEPTSASSTITQESWLTDRFLWNIETDWIGMGPKSDWNLRSGVFINKRNWLNEQGSVSWFNLLPYVWWTIPTFGKGETKDRLELGLELTVHSPSADGNIASSVSTENESHGRFNLAYQFNFSSKGQLRLIATFDIDRFASKEIWEGGNLQLWMAF